MNDLDSTTDLTTDTSLAPLKSVPKRAGLWRVTSMLAILAAVAITGLAVQQARSASDIPLPSRPPVLLEQTNVTVTELPVSANSEVAVLGLPDSESRRAFDATGTSIEIPQERTAVLALTEGNTLVGLSVIRSDDDRTTIDISPRSTAQALMLLSPGVLRPDLEESFKKLVVIEADPAFDRVVQAVRANPNLSSSNEELEQVYAELADRFPAQAPAPDQGCDSVLARDAYPAAGACIQPSETGVQIANEQDRWALLYSGTPGWPDVCAAISPTNLVGAAVLIPNEQCPGEALIVAPGPFDNRGADQAVVQARVDAAAAVNVLYEFVGPFADLAGGSAGFSDDPVNHIRSNFREIESSLRLLRDSNEEFAAALQVSQSAATALDRQIAAISATRLIIETADSTAIIPQRSSGDTGHLDILGFFQRSSERMAAPGTDWRWQANAADTVDFGDGS